MKKPSLILPVLVPALFLILTNQSVRADNSTWLLNPTNSDWNTGANWSRNTVPGDIATFDVSNVTNVSVSAFTPIRQIIFDSTASPFTITVLPNQLLEFAAVAQGITNNSSMTQNFVSAVDNTGQAGNCLFFYGTVSGQVLFTTEASIIPGGLPGAVDFDLSSNSGGATFHNLGGAVGGRADFSASASAGESTIISDGATVAGGIGGGTSFSQSRPSAGNATLIANGGTNGGGGGFFLFADGSLGGTARLEVFGNGYMDVSAHTGPSLSIGSMEGDGQIYLGKSTLMVGTNNLSISFSGVFHPGSPTGGSGTGALTKIGSGTLTLSGANLYTAGTTVSAGALVISNTTAQARALVR
jgi:autotransporter-associated beta strand protein